MMAQTADLSPIDAAVERLTVGWDFGKMFLLPRFAGLTITSVISTTCAVHVGSPINDALASTRLIGGTSIVASDATGAVSQMVVQQMSGCVAGVVYRLSCNVNTSDGQTPNCWTRIPCVAQT